MRILLTSPTYPPHNSGLGNAVAQQAANLAMAGHDVVVVTGGVARDSRRQSDRIRVEIFAITGARNCLRPIRGDITGYVDFLCQTEWDVVLLNAWQNWATDVALCHLDAIRGRKFVYSHCISTNVYFSHQPLRSTLRYLAWRPYWWRLPHLMKRLDGVLFLASGGSDSRFADVGLARRHAVPLRVIPNSLSSEAVAIITKPVPPFTNRDKLIAVGSYQWQKGFDFVLRAYAASRARNHFPLHIYGQQHSAYSGTLRLLTRKLRLNEGDVVFHEGVSGDALIAEYCRARLVLSGSHTECQPLVLLDANAAGTPFVARTTGCIATMPGGVGVHTSEEMRMRIDQLSEDVSLWDPIANAGRQAARNIYHPDHTSRLLLNALEM